MAGAGAAAAGAVLGPEGSADAASSKHFAHGVASGDPHPHGVILWTRVTPVPAAKPGSGVGPTVTVHWEMARDRHFRNVVRRGKFRTGPHRDHTVKVEVTRLAPDTVYHYRFSYDGRHTRVARTRTAPARNATLKNLRLGVVSCANMQAGYFSSYRHLARRDDLFAIVHLGDYIYEYGPGEYGMGYDNKDIRTHKPPHEIITLADYRKRHAQYKTDPDLQHAHHRYPMIATWDDHEVADNSWRRGAENHQADEGSYQARKRHAHRAYDEWMPVRMGGTAKLGDGGTLFRGFRFGTLAELSMLDLRSYRTKQPNPDGDVSKPGAMITGKRQMAWLKKRIIRKQAQWKIIGNPVMITPVVFGALPPDSVTPVNDVAHLYPDDGVPYNTDQWDGYTHDRHELFAHMTAHKVTDAVFITGDIHSGWACDIPRNVSNYPTTGASLGSEFVCTSVTSNNLDDITDTPPRSSSLAVEAAIQTSNKHVKYLNFDDHGYSVLDISPKRVQMDYFIISDRADRNATSSWTASWATKAGSQRVHAVDSPVHGS